MTTAQGGGPARLSPDLETNAAAPSPSAPGSLPPQAHACAAPVPEASQPEGRAADPSSGPNRPEQPAGQAPKGEPGAYGMAPLIRGTLVGLYLALVVPLPVLASGGLRALLAIAVPLGLLLVLAITSETVTVAPQGLALGHPRWCGWWLRRGWSLDWNQITGLTAVATSQGGRVYYLRSPMGSYLLPQRLSRFSEFLAQLQHYSGLETRSIGRISPPWTYQLLAGLTALMLLGEIVALGLQPAGSWTP